METEILFCKDCRHYRLPFVSRLLLGASHAECGRPIASKADLVTGQYSAPMPYCSLERHFEDACGPQARYFKRKAP